MTSKTDLSSPAGISKFIDGIAKRGASLDKDIQTAGVAVLAHLSQHNDVRLVNRLYLALGKGARHAALTSWLLAYGAVDANTDKATKADSPFVFAKDKTTNAQGAAQDPWYSHKPSKAPDTVLDLQAAVRAILKKASKASAIEHGDYNMLKAIAVAAGIPESDVPTKPGLKAKAEDLTKEVGDAVM